MQHQPVRGTAPKLALCPDDASRTPPVCHTPSINTGTQSLTTPDSNVPVNAFSDFLLHHMGSNLADGVSQGLAGPDEFRSAPLWGLGQRIFFLHDGRTNDLVDAIHQHASEGSEANGVIYNYRHLTPDQQRDLLAFLRSLRVQLAGSRPAGPEIRCLR